MQLERDPISSRFVQIFRNYVHSQFLEVASSFPRGFRTSRRWGKRKPSACPDRCYVNVPEDKLLVKVIESLFEDRGKDRMIILREILQTYILEIWTLQFFFILFSIIFFSYILEFIFTERKLKLCNRRIHLIFQREIIFLDTCIDNVCR